MEFFHHLPLLSIKCHYFSLAGSQSQFFIKFHGIQCQIVGMDGTFTEGSFALLCFIVLLSLSHVVSWVRCGTRLYQFLIFATFSYFVMSYCGLGSLKPVTSYCGLGSLKPPSELNIFCASSTAESREKIW